MRVLLIAHKNPYPADDGGKKGIQTMIDGLLLNRVELDVLIMNATKVYRPLDNQLVPKDIKNIKAITIDTQIKPLDAILNLLFEKQSYFISRFYNKQFEAELVQLLNQNKYDIVQLESVFSAVYVPVIRSHSNAKIVLSAHNIEHQIWNKVISTEKNMLKKWYLYIQNQRLKTFEECLFREVDGITAVTDKDKKEILSIVPEKPIVVTPNGLNMDAFPLTPFEQQHLQSIFFLGSLDWIPNQQGILWFLDHVWNKVLSKNKNIHLIVAGKNIPEWLMNKKMTNVRYYSNVPDVKELYDNYAIMVVPLLAGSGIRVKIIEGMAYGKCIISTTIGAEGVPYTHQKDIIIADTPDEFANAIIELIQNPNMIRQIQQNARQLAELHYNRERVYLPLIKLYHELINTIQ